MNSQDFLAFVELFKEACLKCYGYPLKNSLTETESKLLYNQVFEYTGLTVGWKSLKNYSFFILSDPPGKQENPSVSTLDTLARYVLDAPYTTETERKKKEGHYPYWYRYREQFYRSGTGREVGDAGAAVTNRSEGGNGPAGTKSRRRTLWAGSVFILLALVIIGLTFFFRSGASGSFTENFHSVREDSLEARGWLVKAKDTGYWSRRGEMPGCLTLFTLRGDNWPDPVQAPFIRNLVLRKIPCDHFTLEIHLKNFIPRQNWQQAGILLLEDTGLTGKSIRISLAYNDYTGGYPKYRSILIQAITSLGNGFDKPEEIAHFPLFNVDSLDKSPILYRNLENSAIRIEKEGNRFRLLYANGSLKNTSFKEIVSHEFGMRPRYVGLFALKGFVEEADNMPVCFTFFSLDCAP
ncbi:MAG TPA: hypothetical protein VNS58_11715 [Puia sp.]|nr:hypothetical protein [Puia sp.]